MYWFIFAGFNYQYGSMNALVDEFNQTHPGQVDFVAVPTNQFGLQEPGSNEEIPAGLEHVRPGGGFKARYKIAQKNEVNGATADPLFVWLKVSKRARSTNQNNRMKNCD